MQLLSIFSTNGEPNISDENENTYIIFQNTHKQRSDRKNNEISWKKKETKNIQTWKKETYLHDYSERGTRKVMKLPFCTWNNYIANIDQANKKFDDFHWLQQQIWGDDWSAMWWIVCEHLCALWEQILQIENETIT